MSSLFKKKTAVYLFQISLFVPDIFELLKYANIPSDDVINSTKYEGYLNEFASEMFESLLRDKCA